MKENNTVLQNRMEKIGCKLLVLSGKGGVGKSTFAMSLAVSLAKEGKKVGLLDIDVHGPSIPRLSGLKREKMVSEENELIPLRVTENLSVVSIGFFLPIDADPIIWRGPRKHGLIKQFLTDVRWGPLDYLVVDSPPGTGDEPLTIVQLVGKPAGGIIITTPQKLAVDDVRRCVAFCRVVSLPIVGIVENMSGLLCPDCGRKIDLFGAGGGEALSCEMNVPLLGKIPIDPQIVLKADMGKMAFEFDGDSVFSRSFEGIAQAVMKWK